MFSVISEACKYQLASYDE